ncbi:hypothetical protein ES707_15171 [subsurface metagenome]
MRKRKKNSRNTAQTQESLASRSSSVSSASAGFTLLEVLVAISIIAIALVTLLTTHAFSVKNSTSSRIISRAVMLAEEKMTELEINGFSFTEDGEELEPISEGEDGATIYEGDFVLEDEENQEWRHDYYWSATVEETDIQGLAMLTLEVFSPNYSPERPAATIITLIPHRSEEEEEAG